MLTREEEQMESSLELAVGVVVLLVGLVLDYGADDGENDNADHVEVEPVCEGVSVSCLELADESELVGESACIQRNTAHKHVCTSKARSEDEDVLEHEEGEDGCDDGASDRD